MSLFSNATSAVFTAHNRHSYQVNTPLAVFTKRLMATIGLCCSAYLPAHAQLPTPIQQALSQANLNSADISIIIIPMTSPNPDAEPKLTEVPLPALTIEESTKELTVQTDASGEPENIESTSLDSEGSEVVDKTIVTEAKTIQPLGTMPTIVVTPPSRFPNAKPLTTAIRHYPNTLRTPASTMKLIPTFVALNTLGEDFNWFTQVYYTGVVMGETLYGDLIIKGSGDPKLSQPRLAMLLHKVNQKGIKHIQGNIILDTSVFQDVGKDPAAFDNDPLRPYNASPDGLLINFNTVELTTVPNPSHSSSRLYYSPMLADYQMPDHIGYRQGRCRNARNTLAPVWQKEALKFNKKLPAACDLHTFYIAYPDVKDFSKRVVKQQWLELGNTLSGSVTSTEQPPISANGQYLTITGLEDERRTDSSVDKPHINAKNATDKLAISTPNPTISTSFMPLFSKLRASTLPLVTYPSLPLSKQIYDINHYSNNVMAEQVMLSIPLSIPISNVTTTGNQSNQAGGVLQPLTPMPLYSRQNSNNAYSDYPRALKAIDEWWQTHLKSEPPNMSNGSGLCRECTLTAENLAELLSYAYAQPNFGTYRDSLGVAGVSGTIKTHNRRLPHSAANRRAWIKTGTLDNVTAMAGYVHGYSGQDYAVVGIINTPHKLNTYNARRVLDSMLDWTAQH